MESKGIYIFIGPPFSGKETQTTPLSLKLGIPVFSMGAIIRGGRETNPKIEEAFQKYSVNGLHIPTDIKFGLLKEKMDACNDGFILDNFPAIPEDLTAFNDYMNERGLEVSRVFYLNIGHDEMLKRFKEAPSRGRLDDTSAALKNRADIQSKERQTILEYFKLIGKLVEIDGEQPIDVVKQEIERNL